MRNRAMSRNSVSLKNTKTSNGAGDDNVSVAGKSVALWVNHRDAIISFSRKVKAAGLLAIINLKLALSSRGGHIAARPEVLAFEARLAHLMGLAVAQRISLAAALGGNKWRYLAIRDAGTSVWAIDPRELDVAPAVGREPRHAWLSKASGVVAGAKKHAPKEARTPKH